MSLYNELYALTRECRVLEGISEHLSWDEETYMPKGAGKIRAEQVSQLATLIHQKKTGSKFKSALSLLIDIETGEIVGNDLSQAERTSLKRLRRDFLIANALPTPFVAKFAALTSEAVQVWQEARKMNSFSLFYPYLEKIIEMCREKADRIGYKEHPYDALLDEFEPEMTTKECDRIFAPIIQKSKRMVENSKPLNDSFLKKSYSKNKQKAFGEKLLDSIGFDRNFGRLDFSTHPFSASSHPTDSRITTRIDTKDPMSNIFSILHEAGHAFYEMGLPKEHYGSPLAEAVSLGIHESQSRFFEVFIGKSLPFWKFYYPKFKEMFPTQLKGISLEEFYLAIHKIEPSFIRVEADDVTYPLHIMLRFKLEKQLIEGSIKPIDIESAWNSLSQELLGITPKKASDGALQDVHWSIGSFGYFPTYLLGTAYAAQFFEAFAQEYPDWDTRIQAGEFHFVRNWLSENIYQYGRQYLSQELVKKVTKHPFSDSAFLRSLEEKETLLTSGF
ncbi:MAG: carboxypeptidase M32 [Waddliaceae bacterium]